MDQNREVITGRDGFYVIRQWSYGTWELVVGHNDVVGGLFNEWAEGESDRMVHNRARRMISRARRDNPELIR